MFGSTNPFGQSSNSPFGTQSVFGQSNNAANNPFAPKPFGSTSPFGSQTGTSLFGGTSTGVFGATQTSSPLASSTPVFGSSSTPAFGASPTPAFGSSSAPAFGASSTPAFGAASSSAFGGSSVFGQKPAFGAFGSTPSQTSPFGSGFQQPQPSFGSNLFGSTTPFGATSTPAFGATSTPAFGATSTPAFGATSTPAFGSTTTPTFGSTGSAFGVSSTPAFGASSAPAFGGSSTPVFGSSSTPAFGASSTPVFGSSTAPAFGSSSTGTPSFGFGSTPSFGQSTSAFGSTPFGTTPSPFGAQATTPTFGSPGFGQSAFGGQRGGTRVVPYTPTNEPDGQPPGKLESISAMPAYKEKSHEELRWEDHQLGDKGGPNPASQTASGLSLAPSTQSNPFGATSTFGQTASNPFSTSSNLFGAKPTTFGTPGFGASSASAFSSPFGTPSSSPFGAASTTPSIFGGSSTPAFAAGSSASPFGSTSTPAFGSTSSIFGASTGAAASTPAFGSGLNFGNTQSSGLFQSSTPSFGQTTSAYGQTAPSFGQNTPAFGQSNPFSTPSTGFGSSLFTSNSTPSFTPSNPVGFGQTTPSLTSVFQPAAPANTSSAFSFGNFGQTQPAALGGFGGGTSIFGQSNLGQPAASQSIMGMQPMPVTNPFGTLPPMPQVSIGGPASSPSIQYGISSMPVAEKPAPVRISSLLTSRHLPQRSRISLQARKYHPKKDGPKVPFFSDGEETPSTPKADALFIPRENPRALFIRPMERWPSKDVAQKQAQLKVIATPVRENGKTSGDGPDPALEVSHTQDHENNAAANGFANGAPNSSASGRTTHRQNGTVQEEHMHKGDGYISISGHRAGEAAIVYEHGADIEALMPKLRRPDYYTEPRIQELAARERAEAGYCRQVKEFVVGRRGYGSIKFEGETDVRRLDLESIVQFNNKEVIVYMEEGKKPPVGQGLNKPAEITLLNIRCMDKETGKQITEGPKVEKYRKMLMKKTQDQGAEFVSFDPVKGEWKFKVKHFSRYFLGEEADDSHESGSDCERGAEE